MTPSILLKRAEPADLPVLLAYVGAYHMEARLTRETTVLAAALRPLLEPGSTVGRAFLITFTGRPIGYAVLCFGYSIEFLGRDAFLDEWYIEPDYRGRGLGKQALHALLAEARAAGVQALHLEVRDDHQAARRLYAGLGFEPRRQYVFLSRRLEDAP